jgi:hypothetical protein
MKTKVFCVGFHKTGTTSMSEALTLLGYRVSGSVVKGKDGKREVDIENKILPIAYQLVNEYDAFQDNPWPIIFKDLDRKFPGSKFILTMRNSDSWIKSQVDYFGKKGTPMRKWIYGVECPKGNERIYLKRFEDHNREVLVYFKNRSEDFLVMNLSEGDDWNQLCDFLGAEIPDTPFPHSNKSISPRYQEKIQVLPKKV